MNELTDTQAAAIFAMATGMLLETDEGICVEFEDIKYIVSFNGEEISIREFDEDLMIPERNDPNQIMEHGSKLWLHNEDEMN